MSVARKMLIYFGYRPETGNGVKFWEAEGQQRLTIVGERIRSSSNLIADRGQHEAESSEEFGRTRVEFGDDSRHVPLKLTPDVAVGRGDEDRCQRAQSSDDWQREELVISLEIVLAESCKIGKVDSHAREQANDRIQAGESRVCGVHVCGCDLGRSSNKRTTAVGDDRCP